MSPILQSLANGSARGYGAFGAAAAGTAFESIASGTASGSSNSVQFSSISSNFQHLQVRGILRSKYTGGGTSSGYLVFNDDFASNYAWHRLIGDGTSVSAAGSTGSEIFFSDSLPANSASANLVANCLIDIHDYKSTTKFKTVRVLSGFNSNNTQYEPIVLFSGLWRSTSAITKISFYEGNSFAWDTTTQFALYGIKGA